jgi:hypothetical protein
MWVISSTINVVLHTLIQPPETLVEKQGNTDDKWALNFAYEACFFMLVGFFYMP